MKAGSFLESPPSDIRHTVDVDPAALDAGLSPTFGADAAVVIGDAGHSVLKSLGSLPANVPQRRYCDEPAAEQETLFARPGLARRSPSRQQNSRYRTSGRDRPGRDGSHNQGRDTDLGRDLAIKVLLRLAQRQAGGTPAVCGGGAKKIGGQLQHPGIVPVYELGKFTATNCPYFSMKLVKGKTLGLRC